MKVYIPVIDVEFGPVAFSSREAAEEAATELLNKEIESRPYLADYKREELVDILEFYLVETTNAHDFPPSKL